MSDILLIGLRPRSDAGREFFLHSSDNWVEILEVITALTDYIVPVENYMWRDSWLALPTPHLDGRWAFIVSLQIERILKEGTAAEHLEHYYRSDPNSIDYFEGDEEHMADNIKERGQQLDELAIFLSSSGGCRAKWSYEDA
jgi:hypothetical protein